MATIKSRFQLRSGTAAQWSGANPVLLAGEPGFETDTGILRIGDGTTAFTSLETIVNLSDIAAAYQAKNTNLTSLSGLTLAANKGLYATGAGALAMFDLTAAGRALLDDADAGAQRTTLGLGTAALLADSTDSDFTNDTNAAARRGLVKALVDASVAAIPSTLIAAGVLNGTGTPAWAFKNGFSASITDNGAGDYTVAFDSAEADANYVVQITAESPGAGISNRQFIFAHTKTTSGFSIRSTDINGTATDRDGIEISVHRMTWS
jgi:hypothetical protein